MQLGAKQLLFTLVHTYNVNISENIGECIGGLPWVDSYYDLNTYILLELLDHLLNYCFPYGEWI